MALEKMGVKAVIEGLNSFLGGMKKMDKAIEGVGDESKKTAKKTEVFAETFAKIATVAASVGAAMFAAKKAFDFAEEGAQLLRLEQAGESLAKSFGTSMNAIVRAVDKASSGTVARSDIILAANKAMLLGVATSAEQMADLMAVAAVRARAMGLSTTQAFDDIVTGIGRMSPMILDNLGIMTGGAKTFEIYADSVGKTAAELTDTEKKQALFNKVVKESQGLMEDAAESGEDLATTYERLQATMKDAGDAAKKSFTIQIRGVISALDEWLQNQELVAEGMAEFDIKKRPFLQTFEQSGRVIARSYEELEIYVDRQQQLRESVAGSLGITREFVFALREQTGATEDTADATEDLAAAELTAEKAAKKLARQTAEINREFSDLQTLIKTDLSKSYDEMLADIDKVNESEEDLKERIGDVNKQIAEYRREIQEIKDEEGPVTEAQKERIEAYNERISDASGRIADLRGELGKVPARVDEITEAWQRQTKELIFNLAVQRFQVEGLSKEELKVLATLAGPKGLGLVDEAGQAMIEIIAEAGDILDLTGDQSEIVSDLIIQVAEDITNVTGEAENLTAVLEEMTRDAWILRIEQDLFPRRAGGGQRPTVQPVGLTEEELEMFERLGGAGPGIFIPDDFGMDLSNIMTQEPGSTSTSVDSSQTSSEENFNLTINTSAPIEPIIQDFRMMKALGGRV